MNRESNNYIFAYAMSLVAVSAVLLSAAVMWLAPYQKRNSVIEKKLNILQAVHKADSADMVRSKNDYVEANYTRYITQEKVVDTNGGEVEGSAFDIIFEDELAKPTNERRLPVFVCTDDDSAIYYILPLRGAGLWGPIWGYIAIESDMNTIFGAIFDHKSETPGLGAEIATKKFQQQFIGKKLFDGTAFTSIDVKKGSATQNMPHAVDAVSGGTITSEGLRKMMADNLQMYVPFLRQANTTK
jgi:Na+-transporting NADH:ubiquinone oxidoreductase subunit C